MGQQMRLEDRSWPRATPYDLWYSWDNGRRGPSGRHALFSASWALCTILRQWTLPHPMPRATDPVHRAQDTLKGNQSRSFLPCLLLRSFITANKHLTHTRSKPSLCSDSVLIELLYTKHHLSRLGLASYCIPSPLSTNWFK